MRLYALESSDCTLQLLQTGLQADHRSIKPMDDTAQADSGIAIASLSEVALANKRLIKNCIHRILSRAVDNLFFVHFCRGTINRNCRTTVVRPNGVVRINRNTIMASVAMDNRVVVIIENAGVTSCTVGVSTATPDKHVTTSCRVITRCIRSNLSPAVTLQIVEERFGITNSNILREQASISQCKVNRR